MYIVIFIYMSKHLLSLLSWHMEMLRDQKNDESFPCCIAFDFFNGFDELKAFGALESIQEVLGLHEFCIHGSSRNLNFRVT